MKTCTVGALRYGTREDMLFYAEKRVQQLKERGYHNAGLYNPEGVGGTHYMMILHDINKAETYGMPKDPQIPAATEIRQDWLKPLGTAGLLATAAFALMHRVTVGRNIVEEDQPGYVPEDNHEEAGK